MLDTILITLLIVAICIVLLGVKVFFVKILRVDSQRFGARSDAGQRGVRRFLHYFAELSG